MNVATQLIKTSHLILPFYIADKGTGVLCNYPHGPMNRTRRAVVPYLYFPLMNPRMELSHAPAFSIVGVSDDFGSIVETESTTRSNADSREDPVDDAERGSP